MRMATLAILVALSAAALISCSGSDDGGPGPDVSSPTVSSMSIQDGETEVGLVDKISVTFSEPMDPATINDTTFVIAERSAAGFVEYDDDTNTASFFPDSLLAPETWHILTLSGDLADEAGNHYEGGTTSFETGDVTCENLLDHLEPNPDIAQAAPIGLDSWVRTLTVCNGRYDYDYFQFTVDETVKVHARAKLRECIDGFGWITEFRRADGEMYINSGTSGDAGSVLGWYYTFMPGTYWVSVHSSESAPWVFTLYDFMLETDEPCRDDIYEDNDFMDAAAQIAPNQTHELIGCMVDADWFWVDLTQGETLTVTVTTNTGTNRRLRLRDTDQVEVDYYNGTNDPASVSHTATRSGTHFFMTRFWTDGTEYELDITVD